MRNRYWDARCERWGAWRIGGKGAKVASWARLRGGGTAPGTDDHVPELHLEERETAELVGLMPPDLATFLRAYYPRSANFATRHHMNRQTVDERVNVCHRMLARMLDQRRRGESIDPTRRRPRERVLRTKVTLGKRRVSIAATQG